MINLKLLKKNILSSESSISDVLTCLNKSEDKICLILKKKKLVGVITDGDLRRIIYKYQNRERKIKDLFTKKYIFCYEDSSIEKIRNKFKKHYYVNYLPVINKKNQLIGLFSKEEANYTNEVVILAGGMGKRLLPITEHIPKPMINIMGRPFLESLIYSLKQSGFKNINISVNYLKEHFINYFGNGKNYNLSIKYLIEKKQLGTAGPLSLIKQKNNNAVLVINGDIYTNLKFENLINFHNSENNDFTIGTHVYKNQVPYGVINEKKNLKKLIVEKPIVNYSVNSGIYVINAKLLKTLKYNQYIDMDHFINKLHKKRKKIGFFKIHENLLDIGDYKNYNKVKDIIENDRKVKIKF